MSASEPSREVSGRKAPRSPTGLPGAGASRHPHDYLLLHHGGWPVCRLRYKNGITQEAAPRGPARRRSRRTYRGLSCGGRPCRFDRRSKYKDARNASSITTSIPKVEYSFSSNGSLLTTREPPGDFRFS